jgi:hypothetical protein
MTRSISIWSGLGIVLFLSLALTIGASFARTPVVAPPPMLSPLPNDPPSRNVQAIDLARDYVAEHKGIPSEVLTGKLDILREFPNLGRSLQAVTVIDTRPYGGAYHLLVDLSTQEVLEDIVAVEREDHEAQAVKYGKIDPQLYIRVQSMNDHESVAVVIWAAPLTNPDGTSAEPNIEAILTAKYPAAKAAVERGTKIEDVSDPELAARIHEEWLSLVNQLMDQRTRPIVEALHARGAQQVGEGHGAPFVWAVLSKQLVLEFGKRPDVVAISLSQSAQEGDLPSSVSSPVSPMLDSSVPDTLAPAVWSRGIDGNPADNLAILEIDNVDMENSPPLPCVPYNCFLYSGVFNPARPQGDHPTLVASTAASYHSTFRGMAYDVHIVSSAMSTNNEQGYWNAFDYASNQGADVINMSIGTCTDWSNSPNNWDRIADYKSRCNCLPGLTCV